MRSWSRLTTSSSWPRISSVIASQRSAVPCSLVGSNLDSNSRISSRVIAAFDRRTRCM